MVTAIPHIATAEAVVPASALAAAGVEDEGAGCSVPALPDAGSLPTNAKLPDPFKRLNGTRIGTTADWTCRREEIKKFTNVAYNDQIPAGGYTEFGFQATGSGAGMVPTCTAT